MKRKLNSTPKLAAVCSSAGLCAPPCECGADFCNKKMVFNGVRFVCQNGQCTLEEHSSRWPLYEAAPALLKACERALIALQSQRAADDGQNTVHDNIIRGLKAAIRKAHNAERSDPAIP